jgi:DNA adenine methylase
MYDSASTFFYIDPPYIGADMGHYEGYTEEQFGQLLSTLCTIKGNFMLSMYPHEALEHLAGSMGWSIHKSQHIVSATKGSKDKIKIELLVMNYTPPTGSTLF